VDIWVGGRHYRHRHRHKWTYGKEADTTALGIGIGKEADTTGIGIGTGIGGHMGRRPTLQSLIPILRR